MTMAKNFKGQLFETLEGRSKGNVWARIFLFFIVALIVLNVVSVAMETVKELSDQYYWYFKVFEIFSVMVFSIEYVLRIITCTSDERYKHPFWGRLRFVFSPLALVDLLAILPFYLPMLISMDLRFLRVVRLLRFSRLFKIGRYSESLKTFGNVFRSKKDDLIITVVVVAVLLIMSAGLMYFAENKSQPLAFPNIPATIRGFSVFPSCHCVKWKPA